MQVVDLFPTPLVIKELEFDQNEFDFAINYLSVESNLHKNKNNNYNSADTYILNQMPILKSQIEDSATAFMHTLFGEISKIQVTQSWLNYNPPGTSHHKHAHSNSVISGVVYFQTDENTGNLNLYRPVDRSRQLYDEITNWNTYNYEFVYFAPKIGNMFLFPSTLSHSVEENKSTMARISLSFNTFYAGSFGSEVKLSQVPLR
jgi:uncharacterized protein (TIGR02466 family)